MSGAIRQLLGPAKARAKKLITKEPPKLDGHTAATPLEDQLKSISDTRVKVWFDIDKLQTAVDFLNSKDRDWQTLLQSSSLSEAEKKSEMSLYTGTVDSPDGHHMLITEAQDKLSELRSMVLELDYLYDSTERKAVKALADAATPSVAPGSGRGNARTSNAKLPKLKLTHFAGDPVHWKGYWDLFSATVDDQPISNVEKFGYLKDSLSGVAANCVEGIDVTEANYAIAVAQLKERFGDSEVIIQSLYAKLWDLRPPSGGSTPGMRRFLDSLESILRQLESTGENIEHKSLVDRLRGKFSADFLLAMEKEKPAGQSTWTMKSVREVLSSMIKTQEDIMRIASMSIKPKGGNQGGSKSDRGTSGSPDAGGQEEPSSSAASFGVGATGGGFVNPADRECVFCGGNHAHAKCARYGTVNERYERLKEKGVLTCWRCLQQGHALNNCRSNMRCFYCKNNRHHGALCKKLQSNAQNTGTQNGKKSHKKGMQKQKTGGGSGVGTNLAANKAQEPAAPKHETSSSSVSANPELSAQSLNSCGKGIRSAMLLTAKVKIFNRSDPANVKSSIVQLFLDNGSQRSFISTEKARKLKLLSQEQEELSLFTFNSKKAKSQDTQVVEFEVVLRNGSSKPIVANVLDDLTVEQKRHQLTAEDKLFINESFQESFFADDVPDESKVFHPDVVIGEDYFWDFIDDSPKIKLPSGMYVIPSSVGLLLGGRQSLVASSGSKKHHQAQPVVIQTIMNQALADLNPFSSVDLPSIHPNMDDFWSLESVGIMDSPDVKEDDLAVQHFNETVVFEDGRYFVQWPWISDAPQLPDNYWLVMKRFDYLLNRFTQDSVLLEQYSKVIDDHFQREIVEQVFSDATDGRRFHYLPHHPILTPDKATTKVRVVFDASAKSKGWPSLNDCLYRGQVILPDLCGLLLRFRMHPVGISSDVEKAFLNIGLQEFDRDVTRFLWLKNPKLPVKENNLQVYRFARVCFGVKPSPFLLEVTVKYYLNKWATPVSKLISKNIYVDNVIVGCDSIDQATGFYKEAKEIFKSASMNLREWTSNSQQLMEAIPEFDRVKNDVTKILGLAWNRRTDQLQIQCPATSTENGKITKRSVMSFCASVFDPLGAVVPASLPGKLLIQDLWKEKFEWDQELPAEFTERWLSIKDGFENVFLPRFTGYCANAETELHVFADASGKAYASVGYIRQKIEDTYSVQWLFAKNRLTPLKPKVTIPRLELLAILIGCRLTNFLSKEIEIIFKKCFVWTDSECCLHWIKTTKPLARFVENRVTDIKKIQSARPETLSINYVSTNDNPADLATRGLSFSELKDNDFWWHGPKWLCEDTLPEWNLPPVTKDVLDKIEAEHKKSGKSLKIQLGINAALASFAVVPMDVQRFSSLSKLLRATVYCFRFLKSQLWKFATDEVKQKHGLLEKLLGSAKSGGPILFKELKAAKLFWDLRTQYKAFREAFEGLHEPKLEKLNWMKQLGLNIDEDGLLRCHGRLMKSMLPDSAKFPKLLPKDDHYTKLVILDAHQRSTGEFQFHSGDQQTLSDVRREYWIPQGRSAVRRVLKSCSYCRKFQGGPYKLPSMPALPEERVNRAFPFEHTGLDYLGPVWYKFNDEKKKSWICLFTCLVTRAVHLELVRDMTAQEFLNALRRFIARRGPKKILSDNAPQFKLVNDTMQKAWREMVTSEAVISYCAARSIEWKFITPLAPWQGGVYERMVGIVKTAFKKAVGRKMLNFDQLITLVTEIEAVVNSRPLSYISADVNSPMILRPVDFLRTSGDVGAPDFDQDENDPEYKPKLDSSDKLLKYWTTTQTELDKFWAFWEEEYLASLRERTKVDHDQPRKLSQSFPKKDDVVVVHEEMTPRGSWKLGRIQQLHPSKDGNIRSADVLMPNKSILLRSVGKLFPVEVSTLSFNPGSEKSAEPAKRNHFSVNFGGLRVPSWMLVLVVFMALFHPAQSSMSFNRTYVMCSAGRTGHALHIPKKIHCQLPTKHPLVRMNVQLWIQRDEPMKTSGYRCYEYVHEIFTRTGLLWSKGVVGDVSKYSAVSPQECWKSVQSKTYKGQTLKQVSPGLWSTNNTLHVRYKFCCYDVVNTVLNFQIEEGEVASLDGKKAVSDLQDISSCKPSAGFCQGSHATTVWNGTVFAEQCSFKVQGTFHAVLSGYSIVIKQIQGAFSFSGQTHRLPGSECVPDKAFYADQGGVFIAFTKDPPVSWLKLAKKEHLITRTPEDPANDDLFNYRRLFLHKKITQIEREQFALVWHQLCLLKQGQLDLALQLKR